MKAKDYAIYRTYEGETYNDSEIIEIGKIISIKTKEIVAYILYDKTSNVRGVYGMCASLKKVDGKETGIIVLDDRYREYFYKNENKIVPLMFHELGHIINKDSKGDFEGSILHMRNEAVKNGKVLDMELNADKFAVEQLGKSAVINALDFLISERKKRNDLGMESAIKEFEMRKKAIKRMK